MLQTRYNELEKKKFDEIKAWETKQEQDMDEVKTDIANYTEENSVTIEKLNTDKTHLTNEIETLRNSYKSESIRFETELSDLKDH